MTRQADGVAPSGSWQRYELGLLIAIILLAAGLRFYRLGAWSFWIDEIFTINRVVTHYGSLEGAVRTIATAKWMPLSLLLISPVLKLFGANEWTARLVPALIGIASIPTLYLPTRRIFGPTVALLAALLLAISPWHIYWSQNARFYTSLMLLYTLALFALYFGLERNRTGYLLLFLLLAYLAASERLLALFLVPVIACYLLALKLLAFESPPGLRLKKLFLLLLPAIAFGLFEIYSLMISGSSITTDTLDTFGGNAIDSPIRILILIAFNIGIPLATLAPFSGIYLIAQKSRPGLLLFVGAVVPPLLLAAANPFMFTVDRYVFLTLPCWLILGAIAVQELFSRSQSLGRVFALGVLALLLTDAAGEHLMYYAINHGNRPNWREAFAYIQARKQDDDVVVSAVDNVGTYYLQEDVLWLGDIEPETITQGNHRYWFVIDSENGWWSGREKRWVEANADLLEAWYLRTRENMHLRVYLYDPARRAGP